MTAQQASPINDEMMEVWTLFVTAHKDITDKLEIILKAKAGISLAEYHMLSALAAAPENALRMTVLANAWSFSRSGATRLVERLENSGLVQRTNAIDDGRGKLAVITTKGLVKFDKAKQVYLTAVKRHFIVFLTTRERAFMAETFRRLCPLSVR